MTKNPPPRHPSHYFADQRNQERSQHSEGSPTTAAPTEVAETGEVSDDMCSPTASSTDDLRATANRLQTENAELKGRLLRALADAENVRRRAERDLNDMRQYAITKFAGDMVNVADNLERAISALPEELREGGDGLRTFVEGIELTEKELLRSLEAHGIKKLDPTGSRFDPNFHEAMYMVQDPSVPSGTVTTVVQPGYSIGSRSLKPAKVGVAS